MKKTILITSEYLGRGDDELGGGLMGSFLRKLCMAKNPPKEIIFYNSGVRLLAKGSAVLDAIEMLAKKGVGITACGTCINHYQLHRLIVPAQISNMVEIIAELMNSEHVITV